MLSLDTLPPTVKPTCDDKSVMKCDNGQRCYGKDQKCDGYFDCIDHTDEMNCTTRTPTTTTRKSSYFSSTLIKHLVQMIP